MKISSRAGILGEFFLKKTFAVIPRASLAAAFRGGGFFVF